MSIAVGAVGRKKLPYRPCVGIMMCDKRRKIFAGRRIDGARNAWQMPQGGIDSGESPRSAALRELREETGVGQSLVEPVSSIDEWVRYDLPDSLVPSLWGGKFRGQKQKWFLFRFIGTDDQIDIATEEPEFSDWRWLSASEILDHAVPFKRRVYEEVLQAFGPLL